MSLRLLVDENISHEVATQVLRHRADIPIQSVHFWRGGQYLSRADEALIVAAAADGLTLVTYDLKTIPALLTALTVRGQSHAGVVFVDDKSIVPGDIGGLVRGLIGLWDDGCNWDWRDRILFLRPKG